VLLGIIIQSSLDWMSITSVRFRSKMPGPNKNSAKFLAALSKFLNCQLAVLVKTHALLAGGSQSNPLDFCLRTTTLASNRTVSSPYIRQLSLSWKERDGNADGWPRGGVAKLGPSVFPNIGISESPPIRQHIHKYPLFSTPKCHLPLTLPLQR
jgi:hypothetical protein